MAATRLYFAFGSNLHAPRMLGRVPSARFVAVARMADYTLAFRKRGKDGSGKCDVAPAEGNVVWGVVYCIEAADQPRLDAAEGPGYRVAPVTVTTGPETLAAFTYIARPAWYTREPPHAWYRDLVVAGARDHGLPPDYVAAIAAVPAIADRGPDSRGGGVTPDAGSRVRT